MVTQNFNGIASLFQLLMFGMVIFVAAAVDRKKRKSPIDLHRLPRQFFFTQTS